MLQIRIVFSSPEGFAAPDLAEEPQLNLPVADDIDPNILQRNQKMGIAYRECV